MSTRILLVEDNKADALLIQEALGQVSTGHTVDVAADGVLALEHLRSGAPLPDLMLLDLNLPRKDGREVLVEVKADPALASIPVIILTTSESPPDVAFAYRHHANSYVRKPIGLDRLLETASSIRDFWLQTATLPHA